MAELYSAVAKKLVLLALEHCNHALVKVIAGIVHKRRIRGIVLKYLFMYKQPTATKKQHL